MQTYGRLPVAFVRGEGAKLWDSEGKRVPRLPRRPRGHVARPRAPGGRRRDRRPGPHAAARVEPLLQRRAAAGRGRASTGCSAAAARCSSPTRAPRPTSARSSWPAATARPTAAPTGSTCSRRAARSTAAPSPRSRPPASPRSTRRSSRCRTASARWCSPTSTRSAAAMDERVCAVLLEPVQGEGGVQPRHPATSRACARCATSGRRCSSSTRCRPASVAPGSGSASSTPRRAARRRHDGQGARQRHAHRRVLGPRRGGRRVRARRPRHDLRRPAARRARRAGGPRRHGARVDAPALARTRRASGSPRPADVPGVADVRGVGLLHRGRARARHRRQGRWRPRASSGAGRQRGHRRPRCGSRRRCS